MLTLSILLLLLSNAVTLRRDKSILYSRIAIIILSYSFFNGSLSLLFKSFKRGIGLFGGLFHATIITHVFQLFIIFISIVILQLTAFFPFVYKVNKGNEEEIRDKKGEQFKIIEYPLILLFIINGALFLVSTSDLVSIFLSIELQSYGLYLLSTIYRNSELATSGGLTYFLLGGLSSCFILLASSLLYSNSGTTNLDGLYVITSLSDIANDTSNALIYWYKFDYINYSLLILSVGFLFKVSAAPFHFWSPYVYDAIPTVVTTFVAIVAKISIFIFLLELVHYTSNSLYNFEFTWTISLLISSLLSLIIGSVLGLSQFRIKRLFAYSTISHLGFILLALSINTIESIEGFFFYLMQYSISNLNAFFILLAIGYSLYSYINDKDEYKELADKNLSPIQLISQLKGYFYINPMLSLSLTITIFSFLGIPPLVGFFAKQMVLSAALDSGFIFLALIAILTSVISAVYYLNIVKQMFFFKGEYLDNIEEPKKVQKEIRKSENVDSIIISSHISITISILTLIIFLFIFMANEWLNLVKILVSILFN
jgi:NADH-ubiquinone oxidoreductase chain 2